MSVVNSAATHGVQEKNRPDTAFEMGSDRLFTSLGAYGEAATAQPSLIPRYVNRSETDTHSSYTGIAGADVDGSYLSDGRYMQPHKQQLDALPCAPISVAGRGGAAEGEYGMSSIQAAGVLPNARVANAATAGGATGAGYFGVLGGAGASGVLHAVTAPILDVFRPTRRAKTAPNMRVYGSARPEGGASYAFNADATANRPAATNRQFQSVDGLARPNVNRGQNTTAYEISSASFGATSRSDQLSSYIGGASLASEPCKPTSYSSGYAQRNNESKSSVLTGHTPSGSAGYFNTATGAVRLHDDSGMRVTRDPAANRGVGMGIAPPGAHQLGQSSDVRDYQSQWEKCHKERNSKDLLLAFLHNPYTTASFSG
jgi:hypothetical protein